ncbi:hypothetical protein ACIA8I_13885 [Streptomyces rishiriensis]|uniref:hypothetical protein n=1 Tax=Streptomyces rishiriensis TaxID=68264 RepID=UPI00379E03EA
MRKSARVLGQSYGLTAQEMNFILKEEGFLDGEPGNYSVTEKGKEYADEQHHSRGTGGYAQYNRAWSTTTWNDEIANELEITDERKREIRQAISDARRKAGESDNVDADAADESDGTDGDESHDSNGALVAAVGALLLAASAYGVYRAVPYVKRFLNDKALPGIKNVKDRVWMKGKAGEEADSEGGSSNSKGDR